MGHGVDPAATSQANASRSTCVGPPPEETALKRQHAQGNQDHREAVNGKTTVKTLVMRSHA